MELEPQALGHRSILAAPTFQNARSPRRDIKRLAKNSPPPPPLRRSTIPNLQPRTAAGRGVLQPASNSVFPYAGMARKTGSHNNNDGTARVRPLNRAWRRGSTPFTGSGRDWLGFPCCSNTSFNLAGEPIRQSLRRALDRRSGIGASPCWWAGQQGKVLKQIAGESVMIETPGEYSGSSSSRAARTARQRISRAGRAGAMRPGAGCLPRGCLSPASRGLLLAWRADERQRRSCSSLKMSASLDLLACPACQGIADPDLDLGCGAHYAPGRYRGLVAAPAERHRTDLVAEITGETPLQATAARLLQALRMRAEPAANSRLP